MNVASAKVLGVLNEYDEFLALCKDHAREPAKARSYFNRALGLMGFTQPQTKWIARRFGGKTQDYRKASEAAYWIFMALRNFDPDTIRHTVAWEAQGGRTGYGRQKQIQSLSDAGLPDIPKFWAQRTPDLQFFENSIVEYMARLA
jgi:hypothetical protein